MEEDDIGSLDTQAGMVSLTIFDFLLTTGI